MENSHSWDDSYWLAGHEMTCHLLNLKFHDKIHNTMPLIPTLIQLNINQTLQSHFFKGQFNIIVLSASRVPKLLKFFQLLYDYYMLRADAPVWFDRLNNISQIVGLYIFMHLFT
jgi:hypothetical protein